MKKKPKDILTTSIKILIPILISGGLVVWLLNKVNIDSMQAALDQGIHWQYIVIMMLLTMLSHAIRGVRWGIQLRAVGIQRIPVLAECVSIWGAYALNLVIPFIGEAWRCVYISRREKAKLSTVVGTDFGDRISDLVMIIMLIIVTVCVAYTPMAKFMDKYPVGLYIQHLTESAWLWVGILALLGLFIVADRTFRKTKFVQGINTSLRRIWNGFAVLFHLKQTTLYIVLTFGIWTCYYLETYSCFYAFDFTRELITRPGTCGGLIPGLVVFVFGSCSMAIPSNGGLGAWNIAVMFALSLYGISDAQGAAYSLICWSFQSLMLVMLGIFSAIYISASRRRVKRVATQPLYCQQPASSR